MNNGKKRRISIEHACLVIQKVWRGMMCREKLQLLKRKSEKLIKKWMNRINEKICFVALSVKGDQYLVRIYEVLDHYEFLLILPDKKKYSVAYLEENLNYHPLKLYYVQESVLKNKTWEIVTRCFKRISGQVFIFHFFRRENSNKLKVNFFEIGSENERSTFIYSDLNIIGKTINYVKKTIERRILPKLTITNDNLEVKNKGESLTFDAQLENSLVKIKKLVSDM